MHAAYILCLYFLYAQWKGMRITVGWHAHLERKITDIPEIEMSLYPV